MRYVLLFTVLLAAREASAAMAEHAQRSTVAGIDVITYRTQVQDVVTIVGALPAGDAMADPGNAAVPTLSGMMLDRGTKKQDKFAISDKLTNVGAQVSFEVGTQTLEVHAKCLRKDLPLVIGIIAEELRMPALQAAEFAKAKQQFIGGMESSLQNTGVRAREAFARDIYPPGYPNRPHSLEDYINAAKGATLDQVKAFQAQYYGPAHFTLVLVGDVPDAEVRAQISSAFAGWSGGGNYLRAQQPPGAPAVRELTVPLAGKPSVSVMWGQATGLSYRDPDALALRVGTAVLGRGFTGRLMGTVRDKEGLTYGIGATVADDTLNGGEWEISASFAPALLDKGVAATRRELEHWWQDGITEEELTARKQGIIGGYLVGLATTGGVASTILTNVLRGEDLDWLDRLPDAINALTRAQVNQAIKTRLDPKTMALVEAGSVASAAPARP